MKWDRFVQYDFKRPGKYQRIYHPGLGSNCDENQGRISGESALIFDPNRKGEKMAETNNELLDYLNSIEIFDTHEHLPPYEDARFKDTDILKEYMSQYVFTDMVSAGLPDKELEKLFNTSIPLMDRWRIVEKYWDICRYTGHGRALAKSFPNVYIDMCWAHIYRQPQASMRYGNG